jgi:hypothetical protein
MEAEGEKKRFTERTKKSRGTFQPSHNMLLPSWKLSHFPGVKGGRTHPSAKGRTKVAKTESPGTKAML